MQCLLGIEFCYYIDGICWCDDAQCKSDLPLSSNRGYYLDIWSSAEMIGSVWKKDGLYK